MICVDAWHIEYWAIEKNVYGNDTKEEERHIDGEKKKSCEHFAINRYLCKMLNRVDRAPSAAIPIWYRSLGHLYRLHSYHLNEILDFPLF